MARALPQIPPVCGGFQYSIPPHEQHAPRPPAPCRPGSNPLPTAYSTQFLQNFHTFSAGLARKSGLYFSYHRMGTLDETGEGGWHMSNATYAELGAVMSLWRYPVKSMMGEELPIVQVRD